jgi:hypothetical protein
VSIGHVLGAEARLSKAKVFCGCFEVHGSQITHYAERGGNMYIKLFLNDRILKGLDKKRLPAFTKEYKKDRKSGIFLKKSYTISAN